MSFYNIDLANYVYGFNIEVDDRELHISARDVRTAIDAISFKLLPMNVLPYIPSTISPCKASELEDFLEHPTKAFEEYKKMGAKRLIGELKHMGSRATILAFENEDKAMQYTNQPKTTIIYSRKGLPFFKGADDDYICNKIQEILADCDYYNKYNTGFVLMDAEILPWNAKGSGLLTNQYLPVLDSSLSLNKKLLENLKDIKGLEDIVKEVNHNLINIDKYKRQLGNYCWDADITNIKIAPFHLLAHEGKTFFDDTHLNHLNHFKELCESTSNKLFIKTPYIMVDLEDDDSMKVAIEYWEAITNAGFEGLMFKTEHFIEKNEEGEIILPMMKVRGKDYLRIIYGINYNDDKYIHQLRHRNVSKKRFLHYKETALAIESVKAFANGEPFDKWHDYVFANLCLGNVVTDHRL